MYCIICKNKMAEWLEMPLDPKKNQISEASSKFGFCYNCSFGSMSPVPEPEQVPSFYSLENYYTQSEGHMPDVSSSFKDKLLTKLAFILDKGTSVTPEFFSDKIHKNADVLDIGSGGGIKLTAYEKLGWNATGIEPDPEAMTHDLPNSIQTYQGTAEYIPKALKNKKFDFISMTHVLEHCLNPIDALDNVYELSNPGAVFWCEVPNNGCKHFEKFNICSEMFDAPRHIHFFDKHSLVKVIEAAGFEVQEVYFHGFCRHHHPKWREWERSIFKELKKLSPNNQATEHTFFESIKLLTSNIFSTPDKKYDCVGVIAKKPI